MKACDKLLDKVRKLNYDGEDIAEWCGKSLRACEELANNVLFLDTHLSSAMAEIKHSSIRPIISLKKTNPDLFDEVIEEVKQMKEPTRQNITALVKSKTNIAPPEGKYNVIVIDPPWPLADNEEREARTHDDSWQERSVTRPYKTMTLEEIEKIELPAYDDCILWLWTTNINLHSAFHMLEAWEFTYRSCLTWAKPQMGLGYWLRGRTEHCLLATKGSPVWTNTKYTTFLEADRRQDSRKPDGFYNMVDRVCKGSKIDMFSREKREGWATWGDEDDKF